MPENICHDQVERARGRLTDIIGRVAARLGNRKAAVGWLAAQIGVRPATLETLLYHRRAGRRVVRAVERLWARALVRMLRRDLEALEHEMALADGHDVARLAREARRIVAALEEALERLD